MSKSGALTRFDAWLEVVFDWLTALPRHEAAAMRPEIMRTVMLRPGPLLVSGLGILLMSGSAMAFTGALWARLWFGADVALLAVRLYPTVMQVRRGGEMSIATGRRIVCGAFIVFLMFGAGCAASMMSGERPLPLVATAAMMGLIAGLATRWAALPRLAMVTITTVTVPFLTAMMLAVGTAAASLQFAVVAAGTAMLTLQNRQTLVAMFRAERRARRLAATDPLTGLGNRSALAAYLERLELGAADSRAFATLFVDLDHFKRVNDRYGHAMGDHILKETAARLRIVAAPFSVYRIGGDEFLVIIPDGAAKPEHVRNRLLQDLDRPVDRLPDRAGIAASIGIGHGDVGREAIVEIIARADRSLYQVKRSRAAAAGEPAVSASAG